VINLTVINLTKSRRKVQSKKVIATITLLRIKCKRSHLRIYCCCCCSCSVRVLRGANTGRDWMTMLGATGSGGGASEGLTVTATLSSLRASPL
jgi:hypothetical protein